MEFTLERPWGQAGACLVRYSRHSDDRGAFCEGFRATAVRDLGLPADFVQDCWSRSGQGVPRGMHFQCDPLMSKMIRVVRGRACLIAVDVHPRSPSFRAAYAIELGEDDLAWVWGAGLVRPRLPGPGRPHGGALQVHAEYDPLADAAIRWNDPALAHLWPACAPILSGRDQRAPAIEDALRTGVLEFGTGPA